MESVISFEGVSNQTNVVVAVLRLSAPHLSYLKIETFSSMKVSNRAGLITTVAEERIFRYTSFLRHVGSECY